MKIKKMIAKDLKGRIVEIKSYDTNEKHIKTEICDADVIHPITVVEYDYNDDGFIISEITTNRSDLYSVSILKHYNYGATGLLLGYSTISCNDQCMLVQDISKYEYDNRDADNIKRKLYTNGTFISMETIDDEANIISESLFIYDITGKYTDIEKTIIKYDNENRMIEYNGHYKTNKYSYDEHGNMTYMLSRDINCVTKYSEYRYDSDNLLMTYKDSDGVSLIYSYEYHE